MKIKSEVAEWLHTRPNWQQETVDRVLKKERVFNTAAKNEETLAL